MRKVRPSEAKWLEPNSYMVEVKWSEICSVVSILFVTPWTIAHQALLSMGILQARILDWVAMPSSRGSSRLRDWTQVSCIAGRFFTSWATQGKPKKTGVGSIYLLQGIFLTQELNWDLQHCRWILYQLSYQGSSRILEWVAYLFSRGSSWSSNRTRSPALQVDFLQAELLGKTCETS